MLISLVLGWVLFGLAVVVFLRLWILTLRRTIDLEYSIICILRDYEAFKVWVVMVSDSVVKTSAKSNIDLSKRVLWLVGEFAEYFLKADKGLKKIWVTTDLWDFKKKMEGVSNNENKEK